MLLLAVEAFSQSFTAVGKISPYLSDMVHQTSNVQRAAAHTRVLVLTKFAADANEALLAEKYGFTIEGRFGQVLVVSVDLQ